MASVRLPFAGKTLEISSCADNTVRIRLSDTFEPTLFERYGIYRRCGDEAGAVTSDGLGVASADLTVTAEDGAVVIKTPKVTRRLFLTPESDAETVKFFNDRFDGFHIPHKAILGSPVLDADGKPYDLNTAPKHMTLQSEGETFYGLGEHSGDRLILNGRTYLGRVVYAKDEIPIPYIMTKEGYGILSNSTFWHAVDICERDEKQVVWYFIDGELDFTVFAGDSLASLLERFTYFSGRPLLLPKWAYGLTFIEQYNADQFEVMRTAEKFREKKLPCDSISLEPGWMSKNYDFSAEKGWNTDRFAIWDWARSQRSDRRASFYFTSALKRYGFKLHLWLCCYHDFTAAEENLAGNDTDFGIPKWFDHLRQFCNDGADSFKMDPCRHCEVPNESTVYANGRGAPEINNLMQTLYAKEMYYGAAKHRGDVRPMHHYCGGYTGSTAYTATTTGDSGGGIQTLSWILNLGLSGVSNTTCDMEVSDKAALHYGFFTAWCQLNSWAGFCHPWWAGQEQEEVFTFYDRLRYRLLPYIYSAAINANLTGMPVARAMPLVYDDEALGNTIRQYMFGDNFLVGAFTDSIYLPAGEKWIDAWTMRRYEGGQSVKCEIPSNRGGALYIRGGAIIPCDEVRQHTEAEDAPLVNLAIFPHGESSYTFYEDDGRTQQYRSGARAKTVITCAEDEDTVRISIGGREGEFVGMLDERTYRVFLFTEREVGGVCCTQCGKTLDFVRKTDENGAEMVCFDVPLVTASGAELEVKFA